jgi:hypothetical protein
MDRLITEPGIDTDCEKIINLRKNSIILALSPLKLSEELIICRRTNQRA